MPTPTDSELMAGWTAGRRNDPLEPYSSPAYREGYELAQEAERARLRRLARTLNERPDDPAAIWDVLMGGRR
jgi:hypothetical protein